MSGIGMTITVGTIGTKADMTGTIAVGIEIITATGITHGRIGGIRTENKVSQSRNKVMC